MARSRFRQSESGEGRECTGCCAPSSSTEGSAYLRGREVLDDSECPRCKKKTRVYDGLNLASKSKTPGDAWGGVEDGDKEEETVIIQ